MFADLVHPTVWRSSSSGCARRPEAHPARARRVGAVRLEPERGFFSKVTTEGL
jgi:hypothetical protein